MAGGCESCYRGLGNQRVNMNCHQKLKGSNFCKVKNRKNDEGVTRVDLSFLMFPPQARFSCAVSLATASHGGAIFKEQNLLRRLR